ncbi:MAG: HEAT repeat domain-containing protein [Anaerolineae bacterium]|nr:HEAT repeat domain-containing protein [Anaerolineae bacterium]
MAESNYDIWRLQAQSDVHGLIKALKHAEPDIRRRAATALRALGASSAIPALQATLAFESDPEVRAVFISTLDVLFQQELDDEAEDGANGPNQVVRLIAQLSGSNPEHIIRAAQTLAEMKEKLAAETLVMVFHNRQHSARVRLAAAEALLALESAPIEVSLLATLRHKDARIRRNAAAVMGQLGADWAVEPLAAALYDTNEMVRRTAYAALQRIATPEALRAIEPPTPTNQAPVDPRAPTRQISPKTEGELAQSPDALKKTIALPAVDDEDTQPTPLSTVGDDVS